MKVYAFLFVLLLAGVHSSTALDLKETTQEYDSTKRTLSVVQPDDTSRHYLRASIANETGAESHRSLTFALVGKIALIKLFKKIICTLKDWAGSDNIKWCKKFD